jgi:hypothetical protein
MRSATQAPQDITKQEKAHVKHEADKLDLLRNALEEPELAVLNSASTKSPLGYQRTKSCRV